VDLRVQASPTTLYTLKFFVAGFSSLQVFLALFITILPLTAARYSLSHREEAGHQTCESGMQQVSDL
jgi:hypothetical protein